MAVGEPASLHAVPCSLHGPFTTAGCGLAPMFFSGDEFSVFPLIQSPWIPIEKPVMYG